MDPDTTDPEEREEVVDLSRRGLKRIEKASSEQAGTVSRLVLDHNELQRLDNIDSYARVECVSACSNQLVRMHGVSRLTGLRELCLSNNAILQIEGLKQLIHLRVLKLDGNNIKSIEHLNTNVNLQHLDLSRNHIAYIADISYLTTLKVLIVEHNRVQDLRQCERSLPHSLTHLHLAGNNIQDLNEVSHLAHLPKLESFTIHGNPCLELAADDNLGFDYRPFVLNWILSVKSIDGVAVSAIESLKAEWLYSQGRGRHFQPGADQHRLLCDYLAHTCPRPTDQSETAEQRKLRLILTKAQLHQQQLRDSPQRHRVTSPRVQSRLSRGSPDRLSASYHAQSPRTSHSHLQNNSANDLMSRSYDSPGLFAANIADRGDGDQPSTVKPANQNQPSEQSKMAASEQSKMAAKPTNQCLEAASKMVPVPESLMSPDYQDYEMLQRTIDNSNKTIENSNRTIENARTTDKPKMTSSSDTSLQDDKRPKRIGSPKLVKSATSSPKLKPKVEQRKSSLTINKQDAAIKKINGVTRNDTNHQSHAGRLESSKPVCKQKLPLTTEAKAAITIQRMWRGYSARNLRSETLRVLHSIQADRARQHIQRLSCDMEATKAALDSERKIQALQMQAINALWRKVAALQTDGRTDSSDKLLQHLSQTCLSLQAQVESLQSSMQQVLRAVTSHSHSHDQPSLSAEPVATQTDIVAVCTPQEERCTWLKRPQSLPLEVAAAPAEPQPHSNQNIPHTNDASKPKAVSQPTKIPHPSTHPTVTVEIVTHSELSQTTVSHPVKVTHSETSHPTKVTQSETSHPTKVTHSETSQPPKVTQSEFSNSAKDSETSQTSKVLHSETSHPAKVTHSEISNSVKDSQMSHPAKVIHVEMSHTTVVHPPKVTHSEVSHTVVSHPSKIPLFSSPQHNSAATEPATPGHEPKPPLGQLDKPKELETLQRERSNSTRTKGERRTGDREHCADERDKSIIVE